MTIDRTGQDLRRGKRLAQVTGLALALTLGSAAGGEIEPLERILETAHSFLAEKVGSPAGTETRIEVGQLDNRLRLARCAQPPSAQLAPGARTEGSTTVNVRCSAPVSWSIFVPVRIERHVQVVVLARGVGRGQVIQGADIRLEEQETSQLVAGYFSDPYAVIGQQAKRRLTAGQVLNRSQIEAKRLVERGQEVTIFAVRPGLSVQMKGQALEGGSEGERIRVRNLSSKRIVEGYVEPSGAVRVAL